MRYALISVAIAMTCRAVLAQPVTDDDYREVNLEEARLGQLLFYDPILSGNRNIACSTCHHPHFATGDGLSLGLGEGGLGLGPDRRIDPKNVPEQRIPRHAQALFNLGAHEFTVLFHDGRIEVDDTKPSGLRTPLDAEMLDGFATLLSAQTMFPVLSADEMAGHLGENDISKLVRSGRITGPDGAWDTLSDRIRRIPDYTNAFKAVYDNINVSDDIKFTDISNAIAAFIEHEWRSDTSPYDAYLRGTSTLSTAEMRGLKVFDEHCASCHSGTFQTDHKFYNMGVPQLGPGKAASFENHARDLGRMRVTGRDKDAYAFRTPSLRNVAKTAPYGHSGAYSDLREFVVAHADPGTALTSYNRGSAVLPEGDFDDWWVLDQPAEVDAIKMKIIAEPIDLTAKQIDDVIVFLNTLTDPIALNGRLGIPISVPSGLKVDR